MSNSEVELERTYTVPLSRAWIAPRHRRAVRAVNVLKEFAAKHMKSSEIKIDEELNEKMWSRGITKPPRRITVVMSKDEEGLVTISLPKEVKESELTEKVVPDSEEKTPEQSKESKPEGKATKTKSRKKQAK
ncbi:MAG: 50S ribosomal protein L31e [Nitrososphaerales archaeon]